MFPDWTLTPFIPLQEILCLLPHSLNTRIPNSLLQTPRTWSLWPISPGQHSLDSLSSQVRCDF